MENEIALLDCTMSRDEVARIIKEDDDKYTSIQRRVRLKFDEIVGKSNDEFRDLLTMALAGVKWPPRDPDAEDGFLSGVDRLVTYHLTSGHDGYVWIRVTVNARTLLAAMDA